VNVSIGFKFSLYINFEKTDKTDMCISWTDITSMIYKIERNKESLKNAQSANLENTAVSVWLSRPRPQHRLSTTEFIM
jgi:hypothetical protein